MSTINKRITQTGTGASDWVILGKTIKGFPEKITISVEASGTATVDVEATVSTDVNDPTDTTDAEQVVGITGMTGLTSKGLFLVDQPIKAIRINQTAGAGTSAITILANID